MIEPALPENEVARLAALAGYQILDTPEEESFDRLAALAAYIAGTPIATVSLVDACRQWFKAHHGLAARETPRSVSFCGHVVADGKPLIVSDATVDPRFQNNPLVLAEPHVRFYIGLPLRDPGGNVLGTLCAIDHKSRILSVDQVAMLEIVAEQVVALLQLRRMDAAARAVEAKISDYNLFFFYAQELLCTAGPDFYFKDLNPAWEAVFGWTLDELRSRPFTDFVHPEDLASTQREAGRLLSESGTTVNFDNRYRHKSGAWVPLSWTAAVRNGVFFAAARDMSAYQDKVKELAENRARVAGIIESAADAILTIDKYGAIQDFNPAAERLFGYSRADVLGKNVRMLMPSPNRERHDGYLRNYQETGQRKIIGIGREVLALRRDGTSFPAELAVSELITEQGSFYTGILRDVSERKRLERMQSEFVSTVSHELRTPLAAIRGSLGLVAAGVTGEISAASKEYVDMALSSTERLGRLINDILDVEKLQAGRVDLALRCIDPVAAITCALKAQEGLASDAGIRFHFTHGASPCEVVADSDRLQQILANLLSNAIKFSPRDSSIHVSCNFASLTARICVEDQGPGVPPDFLPRLFGRFSQASAATNRPKGGAGLGLNISKSLAEAMGGSMGYEVAPSGGSRFWIELGAVPGLESYAGSNSEVRTVLVCEDDPEILRQLDPLLRGGGYGVHLAPSSERAIRLLQRHTYVAVILDLVLADGDAGAIVAAMGTSPVHSRTPVLVVSGRLRAFDRGGILVAELIEKPFDPSHLLTSLGVATTVSRRGAPKILHVEDDPDLRKIVRATLPRDWQIDAATTLKEARESLFAHAYDVVLLDLSLPDGRGEELLSEIGSACVVIFSAHVVPPELSARVSATLQKGNASAEEVHRLLTSLCRRSRPILDSTDMKLAPYGRIRPGRDA